MWDGIIGWIILLFNNFSLNGFSIHLDPCLNQISHRGLQNGDFFWKAAMLTTVWPKLHKMVIFFKILLLLYLFSSILLEGRTPSSIIFPFSSFIFVCTKYYICMCYHYLLWLYFLNNVFKFMFQVAKSIIF